MEFDGMMVVGLGMAMCAFIVQKGVAELSSFIIIMVAGVVVMKLKAELPAEALMLIAGAIVAVNIFTSKNSNYLILLFFAACLCASIMVLKLFLPPFIMVRMAVTVIFLGAIRLLLF
jgi:hypothetical protein